MSDPQDQRPEVPGKPGPIQTRSRHKRALIVEAAMKVFARYGFSKTTIEDIARQAGIGKATLYYHFDGKEALFKAVLEREVELTLLEIRQATEQESDPEGKMAAFLRMSLSGYNQRKTLARIFRQDIAALMPLAERVVREMFDASVEFVSQLLEEGVEQEVFFLPDVKRGARMLVAVVHGFSQVQALMDEDLLEGVPIEAMIAFALSGLTNPNNPMMQPMPPKEG